MALAHLARAGVGFFRWPRCLKPDFATQATARVNFSVHAILPRQLSTVPAPPHMFHDMLQNFSPQNKFICALDFGEGALHSMVMGSKAK